MVAIVALLTAYCLVATDAAAQFTWIGGSTANGNLSTPENWQAGSVPTGSGSEDITFGALTGTQNVVSLPSFALRNLAFTTGRPAYLFSPAPGPTSPTLLINGDVAVANGAGVTLNNGVNVSFSAGAHTVDVSGLGTQLIVNGPVGGAGSLSKTGTGDLVFLGLVNPTGGLAVADGNVLLDGATLSQSGIDLTVGSTPASSAILTISGSGSASNSSSHLGTVAGTTGTVAVTGAGSTWTSSNTTEVGVLGSGSLIISSGGAVASSFAPIAVGAGSTGSATVTGAGSQWQMGTLFVGDLGQGTLAISSGGSVITDFANVAFGSGSVGTTAVDGAGSSLVASTEIDVGYSGTGMLSITSGATVTTANAYAGNNPTGAGLITITGTGSSLNLVNSLVVGFQGAGAVTLQSGGKVSIAGGADTVYLGGDTGGAGLLNIGSDSALAPAAGGIVDAATITSGPGAAQLQLNTDGTSGTPYYLTRDGTSGGTPVAISGLTEVVNNAGVNVVGGANTHTGGTYVNAGELIAGSDTAFGTGPLTFSSANSASARFLTANPLIGSLAASAPSVSLYFNSDNAILTVNQALTQPGSFGGEIRSDAPGDSLRFVKSGPGTLRLDSGGLYVHNGAVDGLRGGTEISIQVTQGTLLIANPFYIEDSFPTISIDGGTLALEDKSIANPVVIGSGGRLAGNGTLTSPFTLTNGATLAPGFSPGTLTFTNGLTLQDGSGIDFEVQSATGAPGVGYDTLVVSGGTLDFTGLTAGGLTLKVISLDLAGMSGNVSDFSSSNSYSWLLFDSAAGMAGFSPSLFNINTMAFTNSLGTGNFFVSQSGTQVFLNFTPVPEPSTFALVIAGLGILGLTRSRRRA